MSGTQHKQLRPGNRAATGNRIKLHLRLLWLNGKLWRVLTLRPGTDAAFSTNFFHDTWHFVSDKAGAELLARIFWGLSYQREPNTLFLLHGEHLKPTPFEAEPSLPFVIVPAHVSTPDPQALAELKKKQSHLSNSTATVRLQTWGLDELIATDDKDLNWRRYGIPPRAEAKLLYVKERVTLCGGIIAYCAPPGVMRVQSCQFHYMHYWAEVELGGGMDYLALAEHTDHPCHLGQGEIQIFIRYRAMLSEAAEARRELETQTTEPLSRFGTPMIREAIWNKAEAIAARRKQARQYHSKKA